MSIKGMPHNISIIMRTITLSIVLSMLCSNTQAQTFGDLINKLKSAAKNPPPVSPTPPPPPKAVNKRDYSNTKDLQVGVLLNNGGKQLTTDDIKLLFKDGLSWSHQNKEGALLSANYFTDKTFKNSINNNITIEDTTGTWNIEDSKLCILIAGKDQSNCAYIFTDINGNIYVSPKNTPDSIVAKRELLAREQVTQNDQGFIFTKSKDITAHIDGICKGDRYLGWEEPKHCVETYLKYCYPPNHVGAYTPNTNYCEDIPDISAARKYELSILSNPHYKNLVTKYQSFGNDPFAKPITTSNVDITNKLNLALENCQNIIGYP